MTGRPLVSVVVPFFDSAAFLEECIESVLGQTYTRWELLLVDDGATDGSTAIAQRYAARNPGRVTYLTHPERANRGVSGSRNLGLRRAQGEFIAFLDADDVWVPEKLEDQVTCLEQHPDAVMVYGSMRYWYSWTGAPEDAARDHVPDQGGSPGTVSPPPQLLVGILEGSARAPLPSDALLRLSTVREVGGFEEERKFSVYEDRVFFVKIALSGGVFLAPRCWVKYRQHENSSSSVVDRTAKRAEARRAYLVWLDHYLSEQGYRGTRLWSLAHSRSRPPRHPLTSWALHQLQRGRRAALACKRRVQTGVFRHKASLAGAADGSSQRGAS